MECRHCKKFFESTSKLGGHIIWCKENPNNNSKNLKERFRRRKETFKTIDKTKFTGKASTIELELIRRQKISNSMKLNPNAGGLREGSGRGVKQWYNSKIAGKVYLRSTYEFEYVKWLDKNNIKWVGNKKFFEYDWLGEKHKYYPDFYLIDEDCYIEIKGFKTTKDEAKWKSLDNLKILFLKDLIELNIMEGPK